MDTISPCLWFDGRAEEAATLYVSLFRKSRIVEVARSGEAGTASSGGVLMVMFELDGRSFLALNGGTVAGFTEALSLSIDCADQAEVDRVWAGLSEGGAEGRCGWLKDRFGVSWQVVPSALRRLLGGGDPVTAKRVMAAMLRMGKIDIAALEAAARG